METKFVTLPAVERGGRIVHKCKRKRKSVFPFLLAVVAWIAFVIFVLFGHTATADIQEPENGTAEITHTQVYLPPVTYVAYIDMGTESEGTEPCVVVDAYELECLALVIYQEAGGDECSDETRQMVGEVALNRVEDGRFPNTLAEVLTQKQQYGRLYWTGLAWPERASLESEAHAVERAYAIAEKLLTSTDRLLPDDVIFQAEFRQGTETIAESDGFYFCR